MTTTPAPDPSPVRDEEEKKPDTAPAAPARRFWAVRRVPAALLAAVVLGGAGLLLYDVAAVRADHSAMAWRKEVADGLATRPLDSTWVLVGASLAAALGLWLLFLALTPGLRSVLPMRRDHPDVRAGLDRGAASLILRDRAMEVSGVQSAKVRVRRSKAAVRAVSHFRDLDEVRADLEHAIATGIDELGLARPPAPKVRVARPPRKG
ncbi:hypothetical protein GCM10010497_32830 [Streptomyces cinereoruber]|uniref:DUF6286 domain-containing protein n=1 Tax=Streptomyces cinereoruber TaxID=67260 RepID=A0AAV4KLA1_9ACTN|nr:MULTISPECIES: DUF6286 domain-containing protein [Streptomyces]AVH98109.1 hypothetical protein C5L38_26130 [Streptomyces sp. WAC00288]KYG56696.1 hypothetical protein AWI43_21740 [Streptomyces sp. WAC04657]MBB4161962.1 hypothetical protein [Streptomyces cinereoruber]MBY8817251.1 DUF6286 domain-containing protein [Streptomyces cinereoruber]NIH64436.1 hypothetical protein [Streptomyces cinereoruber]